MLFDSAQWSLGTCAIYFAWFLAGYITGVVIYRRYWHPLAKIPGPFFPAVTTLYQSYYNGLYYRKVEELHKRYGPVVRIQPNEVSLCDPANYDKIYYMGTKFFKSPVFYNAFGQKHSTFGAIPNDVHKYRRSLLNPMFSRKMVMDLEYLVQETVDKLLRLMNESFSRQKPFNMHNALRCVSVDVFTTIAFDESFDLLDTDDLGADFNDSVLAVGPVWYTLQQLTFLQGIAFDQVPPWIASRMTGFMRQQINLHQYILQLITEFKERKESGKLSATRPTLFSELLDPANRGGEPLPSNEEIKDEAVSTLAAAAETVGSAMTTACFNVMCDRQIYGKLRHELLEHFPDPSEKPRWADFERLPYLTGIIKESIRLSFGVPGRLPRVVPETGATFNGHYLPPGSVVGMSSWMMHRNEEIFPNAMKFEPERWLDATNAAKMERYMVAFGKGPRQCVGMQLAYCELYVTLGRMFHRFPNLELFETTAKDMEFLDHFASCHKPTGKKLHAISHV